MKREEKASAVLEFLEARSEQIIDLTSELVATPSPNPPGDERAVVTILLARMAELGLTGGQVLARVPERPNIVYHQPGRGGGPRLFINGHTDTKPVGAEDRKLWQTDPLQPTIIDGMLHGLGSTDMKGGLAAAIYAAAALKSLAEPVAGDLQLIFTANEEAPGEYGANWLVKHHHIQADFGLVVDGGSTTKELDSIHVVARNTVLFKVKVNGTQMHSSVSDRHPSVNASLKMAWVMCRMAQDLKLRYEPHPYFPLGPTINLGDIVSGGGAYGTLSGYAEFCSDIRIIPGMTRKEVVEDIEQVLEQLRAEDPELKAELEVVGGGDAVEWKWLAGDEPFVRILQDASERVLGWRPLLTGVPGFTDGYWFHSYAGIPTVPSFGPGNGTAHTPNECVSIEAIVQASKIYALAALEYLDGTDDTV